jgi:hypothetical protein
MEQHKMKSPNQRGNPKRTGHPRCMHAYPSLFHRVYRSLLQARCSARICWRDRRSPSSVAGSAIISRTFSCSSQTITSQGHILTSKLSRHSPSPHAGRTRPDAVCPAGESSSSEDGDAFKRNPGNRNSTPVKILEKMEQIDPR